jgi:hypothetical protein
MCNKQQMNNNLDSKLSIASQHMWTILNSITKLDTSLVSGVRLSRDMQHALRKPGSAPYLEQTRHVPVAGWQRHDGVATM